MGTERTAITETSRKPRVACVVILASLTSASPALAQSAGSLVGRWAGTIRGEVYRQTFELPIQIDLARPSEEERNPVALRLLADRGAIGGVGLMSFTNAVTPTGQVAAIHHLTIDAQATRLRAVTASDYRQASRAINAFTGPNVELTVAPTGPEKETLRIRDNELFGFDDNLRLELAFTADDLRGTLTGSGTSYTAQFAMPGVVYRGDITARRVSGSGRAAGERAPRSTPQDGGGFVARTPNRSSRSLLLFIVGGVLAVLVLVVVAANRR